MFENLINFCVIKICIIPKPLYIYLYMCVFFFKRTLSIVNFVIIGATKAGKLAN